MGPRSLRGCNLDFSVVSATSRMMSWSHKPPSWVACWRLHLLRIARQWLTERSRNQPWTHSSTKMADKTPPG